MKKIIFGLIALSTMTFTKEIIPAPTVVSEVTPVMIAPAISPILGDRNIYLRVGGDLYTQFNDISYESIAKLAEKSADGFGFEAALEYTKISTSRAFELGLGIAYQSHAGFKNVDKNILLYNVNTPTDIFFLDYHSDINSFASIPIYITAKYNFPVLYDNFIPYIKADGGYSFNISDDGSVEYRFFDPATSQLTVGKGDTKFTNGAYAGLGVGVEYNNFLIDLMFKMNTGKVKSTVDYITYSPDSSSTPIIPGSFSFKENVVNYRATLSIGYKFNF